MDNTNYKFNENNFDLIRLFAAFEVALHHSAKHLVIEHGSWLGIIMDFFLLFPGVPIFFFISGFLISRSYESNSVISEYSKNRLLRLFPGLVVCGVVTTAAICLSGYIDLDNIALSELLIWFFTQATFFQFYDPDFLFGYGIGQSNGSLWTIYIEIQFYILVPMIYTLFKKLCGKRELFDYLVIASLVLFFIAHFVYVNYLDRDRILYKLLTMSFIPYFYMFLTGVLFQRHHKFLERVLSGKFLWILGLYVGLFYLVSGVQKVPMGNAIHPAFYVVLCCLVFSAAFTDRLRSRKILGRNDVSYGLYIYHMPVVNLLIYLGYTGKPEFLILALGASFSLAIMSWIFVERPSMKLKNRAFNSLDSFK